MDCQFQHPVIEFWSGTVSRVGRLRSPSKLPETLGKPFSWFCKRGAPGVCSSSIRTEVCCCSVSMTSAADTPLPLLFTARKTSSSVVSARPYPLIPSSCFDASRSSNSLEKLHQEWTQLCALSITISNVLLHNYT